jgi:hypothetical protein
LPNCRMFILILFHQLVATNARFGVSSYTRGHSGLGAFTGTPLQGCFFGHFSRHSGIL